MRKTKVRIREEKRREKKGKAESGERQTRGSAGEVPK
jgi:hypothetical protein